MSNHFRCKKPRTQRLYCGDGVFRPIISPLTLGDIGVILTLRSKDELLGYKTPCRIWVGSVVGGYGTLKFNGKTSKAHRLAWMVKNGPIPPGKEVCHDCDNPACINVDHLWLGTHKENMQDAALKKRIGTVCGERHYARKLLSDDVRFIRINRDIPGRKMAAWFGVTQTLVSKIRRGVIWKGLVPDV